MTTLITIGDSEGERRCDARCHDAVGNDCSCVCGGMNHGVGLRRAQIHTAEIAEQLQRRGCEIPAASMQTQLF